MAKTWLDRWEPENPQFWKETGKKIAWRTLTLTTFSLVFSFATWFAVSAIVVRLPGIGFKFDAMQLFWLAAMPGLAGGTLRIVNTFLIPLWGSRRVITIATLLKIIPCIGLGLAILNPGTPWWLFMVLAFSLGLGGGDFSSFMPSTSLFFPKRLQGLALGIQAGVGNFGVSLTQFVAPWIISFAALGALAGAPQTFAKVDPKTKAVLSTSDLWLQNAILWYVPLLLVAGILCWIFLRSIPVRASFREQTDIFKDKHTWFCTITYVMTFGSFSGFSAAFPLMIKETYGGFGPGSPDPLAYAFLGPLVGSVIRVVMGAPSDRWGGSIFTHMAGIALFASAIVMAASGLLTPTSLDQFPYFVGLMLVMFFAAGTGNASTFRQYPIIFAHSPRQGAGVLGWTGAVAAYGPFIFSVGIGAAITQTGSAKPFFIGIAVFYFFATAINWWYYTRKGAEREDRGSKGGTWWDRETAKAGQKSGPL